MATKVVRSGLQQVKPMLSSDKAEARRRVLKLYKSWFRQLPVMISEYNLCLTETDAKAKLREKFQKNSHVTDIRAIDLLVIKGQQDLVEVAKRWKQTTHIMMFFKDTEEPRPTDFMSKFLDGQD